MSGSRVGIILGASSWKNSEFFGGDAFKNSYKKIKKYFVSPDGLSIPDSAILDYFDASENATDILQKFHQEFTSKVDELLLDSGELDFTSSAVEVFFYFVGHGEYSLGKSNALKWVIRATDKKQLNATSLNVTDFVDVLKERSNNIRCYGIIDCCFSAKIMQSFQSERAFTTKIAKTLKYIIPRNGFAVLCATPPNEAARISKDLGETIFTKGFIEIVDCGWGKQRKKMLSMQEVSEGIRLWITENDQEGQYPIPAVFDPDQKGGLLSAVPIFNVRATRQLSTDNKTSIRGKKVKKNIFDLFERDEERHINLLANCAETSLYRQVPAILSVADGPGLYAYKSRVKNAHQIAEKIVRKREHSKEDYSVDDLGDIVGLKFISLFKNNVFTNVELLVAAINGSNPRLSDIFVNKSLYEAIIYTTDKDFEDEDGNNFSDQMFDSILAWAPYLEKDSCFVQKRQSYSGVHLLARINAGNSKEKIVLPVEIQLRTVYEDAWSEAEHSISYSQMRSLSKLEQRTDPSHNYLKVLKGLLDQSAELAEFINRDSKDQKRGTPSIVPTVDNVSYLRSACRVRQVPKRISAALVKIISAKEKLDSLIAQERLRGFQTGEIDRQKEKYADVAKDLNALYQKQTAAGGHYADRKGDDEYLESRRAFVFLTRMEEAVCLTLSNNIKHRESALYIYKILLGDFDNCASLHLRLALLYAQVGENDRALDHYIKVGSLYYELCELPERDRLIQLGEPQKNYIENNLGRLHSFQIWRRADKARQNWNSETHFNLKSKQEIYDEILEAYEIACRYKGLIKDPKAKLRINNNILAYLNDLEEIIRAVSNLDFHTQQNWETEIRECLAYIETDQNTDEFDWNILDSLTLGNYFVGEREKAKAYARKIRFVFSRREELSNASDYYSANYLSEVGRRVLKRALEIEEDRYESKWVTNK